MFTGRLKHLEEAIQSCVYSEKNLLINEERAFLTAIHLLKNTKERQGIVYVIGNGGSAGIASHFSTDLIKSMRIPSQTLYDSNLITCLGNDYGYEHIFSYPLEQLLKPADLVVVISSSGKSPNIVKAAEVSLSCDATLLTLSGFSPENPLRNLGHLNFWIDRHDYGLVETSHFFLLHTLIDLGFKQSKTEEGHGKIATTLQS